MLTLFGLAGCISQPLSPEHGKVDPENREIAQLRLEPTSVETWAGMRTAFVVEALDAEGEIVLDPSVVWESSDTDVAIVDRDGTVWSFADGSADVTVRPDADQPTAASQEVYNEGTVIIGAPLEVRPERVSDLSVDPTDEGMVELSFTEVDDGSGEPADYLVRFQMKPLAWSTAANVTYGSCAGVVEGTGAGNELTCSVANLSDGNDYEFQVVALRGGTSATGPHGHLSNVVGVELVEVPAPEETEEPSPEGLITRHTFSQKLEDGWEQPVDPEREPYSIGEENGDSYGQAEYRTNLCTGCAPIMLRRGWDALDELTIEMRWQVSSNMFFPEGSSKFKKIFFLETPGPNPVYIGIAGDGPEIAVATQRTAEPDDGATRAQGGPNIEMGRIYDVTMYVKLNSVDSDGMSVPDGVLSVWLDGEKIINRTDMRYRGEDSPQVDTGKWFKSDWGITGIRWNPTWINVPPPETMWERLYEISVYAGDHTT